MRNLLTVNFRRVWRSGFFWSCFVGILVLSAATMLLNTARVSPDSVRPLEEFYFSFVPFLSFFAALFVSMWLGTEYSDGVIRNKLVVGHTRVAVYLANQLTCIGASLLFVLAWLVGGLVGIPLVGVWSIGTSSLLLLVGIAAMLTVALTALFTCITMLSTNKAMTVTLCVILLVGLLVGASVVYDMLSEPEISSGMVFVNGVMEAMEPAPNPRYVSGTARTVYELLLDLLPTGQSILLANLETSHPLRQLALSTALLAVTTVGGVAVFRKKDLK